MKISVVIITHNEEKNIEKCISSILNQTNKADEIILVAHNCTDKTIEIASKFPIIIKKLEGKEGITYARIHGISNASGDKILCIDGDAFASKNWILLLSGLLDEKQSMMAGTFVKYTGNFFWFILGPWIYLNSYFHKDKTYWLFGPSFGFTAKIKPLVLKCLEEFPKINKCLNLYNHPDDFWVAFNANNINPIRFTYKTKVITHTKDKSSFDSLIRSIRGKRNANILKKYFIEKHIA